MIAVILLLIFLVGLSAWQAYRIEARHQETLDWLDAIGEMISDNLSERKDPN